MDKEIQQSSETVREIYQADPMPLELFLTTDGFYSHKEADAQKITEGGDGGIFLIPRRDAENQQFNLIAKFPLSIEDKPWNKQEGLVLAAIQDMHLRTLPTPAVKMFADGQWVMEHFSKTKGLYPIHQIQEYAARSGHANRVMYDWSRAMMSNAELLSRIGIASTDNKAEHMYFYVDKQGRVGIRNIDFANVKYTADFAQKCEGLAEPKRQAEIAALNLKNAQENILAVLSQSGHVSDFFTTDLRGGEKKYDPVFDYVNIICAYRYLKDTAYSENKQIPFPENILSLINSYEALSAENWQDFYIQLMLNVDISSIISDERFFFLNDCRNEQVIDQLFARGKELVILSYDGIDSTE